MKQVSKIFSLLSFLIYFFFSSTTIRVLVKLEFFLSSKHFKMFFEFRLLSNALIILLDGRFIFNEFVNVYVLSLYLLMFANSSRCKTDQKYKLLS